MEDEIMKAAGKLGEEIGKSKIWNEFRKASGRFKEDKEVQELLKALREKEQAQSEKLTQGLPVEVSEKRAIKEIEEKLASNEVFLEFIQCENRYLALMGNIDRAIKEGTDAAHNDGAGSNSDRTDAGSGEGSE